MAANGLTYEHGGRYLVKPVRWGLTESKEKKTPQFFITAEILGQIDPQNPQGELIAAPQGERTCFWFLTENAIGNMIRDLADMGYQGDLQGLDSNNPNAFDFSQREMVFSCTHEQYNGRWRERWQYGTGGSFNPLPLEQKEILRLNAMFGSHFKKLGQSPQGRATAPVRSAAPTQQAAHPRGWGAQQPAAVGNGQAQPEDIPF